MEEMEELLAAKHMKRTKARIMILRVLQKSLPLTAGEVYEAVRSEDTRLSLSTVYRNCEALAEKGVLVRSTMLSDGLTRYEFAKEGPVQHAICLSCHRIFPVELELEKRYREKLDTEYGFEAVNGRIEIYGFCEDCRKDGKAEAYKAEMGWNS